MVLACFQLSLFSHVRNDIVKCLRCNRSPPLSPHQLIQKLLYDLSAQKRQCVLKYRTYIAFLNCTLFRICIILEWIWWCAQTSDNPVSSAWQDMTWHNLKDASYYTNVSCSIKVLDLKHQNEKQSSDSPCYCMIWHNTNCRVLLTT